MITARNRVFLTDSVASVHTASMCTLNTSLWPVLLKTQPASLEVPVLATSKLKGVEAYDKSYKLPCGLASSAQNVNRGSL